MGHAECGWCRRRTRIGGRRSRVIHWGMKIHFLDPYRHHSTRSLHSAQIAQISQPDWLKRKELERWENEGGRVLRMHPVEQPQELLQSG